MADDIELDFTAARVDVAFTANDTLTARFRIKDADGVIADPEGDGWTVFGQVRDKRGGTIEDDMSFEWDGEWCTQTWPSLEDGSYWWEKQLTDPDGVIRSVETGRFYLDVDSAEEGS